MDFLQNTKAILKRELISYFGSAVAYVFLVVFLMLTAFLTFAVGQYYENGQADLRGFFFWHPWVYLILVPAAAMRLWAEERRSGTIELLLTMPVTLSQAIVGKFLAAWAFLAVALVLTLPVLFTTLYLGQPDLGVAFTGYIGSLLLAGAYLSVGMLTSAMTRNQVISFVLSVVFCLFLLLAGWPPVTVVPMAAPHRGLVQLHAPLRVRATGCCGAARPRLLRQRNRLHAVCVPPDSRQPQGCVTFVTMRS
jgi:ABC-2 type transport system permease protein